MSDYLNEPVPEVSPAAVATPDANVQEIRARAADAIIGLIPDSKAEEGSVRRASPLFERLLSYGSHAALAACLVGFAWLAGPYLSGGQQLWTVAQKSVEHAAEGIRTLKADVEAMQGTRSLSAKDAAALEGLNTQLNLAKTETSAAIAELASRVEHLERESAAKLSQIYERLDRIEHQIAASKAASLAAASESGATIACKRAHGGHSDAFDPSQKPNAPGVPRPLGRLAHD